MSAGLLSLLNVPGPGKDDPVFRHLDLSRRRRGAVCRLFASNTMPRIVTMRAAYVLTATVISLAGIAGYFSLFPHAHDLFATYDRALGAFKDPNVFGPFLIWPALVVIERMLARHIAPRRRADRRHPVVRLALELFTRRLVSFRGVLRGHDVAHHAHRADVARTPAHFRAQRDQRRGGGGVRRRPAVVSFDRQHVRAARATHPVL